MEVKESRLLLISCLQFMATGRITWELRRLKEQERILRSLESKLRDQLNRLKVEELAVKAELSGVGVSQDLDILESVGSEESATITTSLDSASNLNHHQEAEALAELEDLDLGQKFTPFTATNVFDDDDNPTELDFTTTLSTPSVMTNVVPDASQLPLGVQLALPSSGLRSSEPDVIVDALPYFDQGYDDPGVRDAAIQLVQEESKRYRPTRNYLDFLPPPNYHAFETELMKQEFDRLQNRLPMEMLSMKRYELPPPPAGKMTDVSAWLESVENSQSQLEHQSLRIMNLNLLTRCGPSAWRQHVETLQRMVDLQQAKLEQIRKKIQDINWQRKKEQTDVGNRLKALEETWVTLVSKNYEIELVCAELEASIEQRKQEMQLREENYDARL